MSQWDGRPLTGSSAELFIIEVVPRVWLVSDWWAGRHGGRDEGEHGFRSWSCFNAASIFKAAASAIKFNFPSQFTEGGVFILNPGKMSALSLRSPAMYNLCVLFDFASVEVLSFFSGPSSSSSSSSVHRLPLISSSETTVVGASGSLICITSLHLRVFGETPTWRFSFDAANGFH